MKQRLFSLLKYPLLRTRRFMLVNLLHANDPPHKLALGVAIGVFIAITPTFGFQMALVVLFAWLLSANKVVGLPIVWLTNPATMVPIYYGCYWLGRRVMGSPAISSEWWTELRRGAYSFTFYWEKLMDIAAPLWVGSLVMAAALAYPSYYVTYFMVRSYRLKRWGQLTPPEDSGLDAELAALDAQARALADEDAA